MYKAQRIAFTLVELMAAMVVISIMAGMVFAALSAATGSAKRAAAETQVAAVQQLLIFKMEDYLTRRMPAAASLSPASAGYQLQGPEANRSRLIMLRHAMRFELPDRKSDLIYNSNDLPVIQQAWVLQSNGNLVVQRADVSPLPTRQRYLTLLQRLTGTSTEAAALSSWSTRYESSEALYLILATSQVGGRSGLEMIPTTQISDLDGDGIPEVLDPWGNPMVWVRWPVGYWLTYPYRTSWALMDENARVAVMNEAKLRAGSDQFDILQSDWRNLDNIAENDTFNLQPLVMSAGPDGEFDMMLRSSDPGSTDWYYGDPIFYGDMTWKWNSSGAQVPAPTYGSVPSVGQPYSSPYDYIDPYATFAHGVDYAKTATPFTTSYRAGLPGAYFDANDDGVDDSADNIFSVPAL